MNKLNNHDYAEWEFCPADFASYVLHKTFCHDDRCLDQSLTSKTEDDFICTFIKNKTRAGMASWDWRSWHHYSDWLFKAKNVWNKTSKLNARYWKPTTSAEVCDSSHLQKLDTTRVLLLIVIILHQCRHRSDNNCTAANMGITFRSSIILLPYQIGQLAKWQKSGMDVVVHISTPSPEIEQLVIYRYPQNNVTSTVYNCWSKFAYYRAWKSNGDFLHWCINQR